MKLAPIENLLGHSFRSPDLLIRALTHRSWAHENADPEENETLEFLGDSVVGLIVAEELYRRNPTVNEGGLTLMKHTLVRMEMLATAAERLKLGDFVRLSGGEEKVGGRKKPAILADVFEAVVAAIFLDGGYAAARNFVTRVLGDELRDATPQSSVDYKTLLQESLQANKMAAPTYQLVRSEGQPHARTFFVEAIWESGRSSGSGRSIKAAEMMAASKALDLLGGNEKAGN